MRYDKFRHMYKYKGYYYEVEVDYIEDNMKSYHLVIDEKFGISHTMPVSPYYERPIPEDIFRLWIDMDMPNKEKLGGTTRCHYEDYYGKWVTEQLEKALDLETI